MKSLLRSVFAFGLILVLTLQPVCAVNTEAMTQSVSKKYEYAWFPSPIMSLSQLPFESFSHTSPMQNGIDMVSGGCRLFAPFTGRIVYMDFLWGYVVFQSADKVYFADGTLDYMTVCFMHDENISDLTYYYNNRHNEKGIIAQGTPFYDDGGQGWGYHAFPNHVHLSVNRGHIERETGIGSYGGGNMYAYDALFINPEKTTQIINRGKLNPANYLADGGATDWSNLWKDLPQGYLSNCTYYPSYATLTIPSGVKAGDLKIRSIPCNENTAKKFNASVEYEELRIAKTDQTYTAVAMYRNTEGNYWYKVIWKENGEEKSGYLFSKATKVKGLLWEEWNELSSDATYPTSIKRGNWYPLSGTVSADKNGLFRIYACIKDTATGEIKYQKSLDVNGSGTIQGPIDDAMAFDLLPAGNYTYEIYADLRNYTGYEKSLIDGRPAEKRVPVLYKYFAVVDPQPVTFTVSFNGGPLNSWYNWTKQVNGGSMVGSLPRADAFGYIQTGWFTAPEGGTQVLENYVVTGHTRLYAQYRPKNYTLIFNVGSDSNTTMDVPYGSQMGTLPTPSRNGYVFDGWYTAETGGQRVTADTYFRYNGDPTLKPQNSIMPHSEENGNTENEDVELPFDGDNLLMNLYAHWSIATGSGRCGDNLTWEIDSNGVLRISGFGPMYEYASKADVPWNTNRDAIQGIILPSGLTTICDYAFSNIWQVRSVEIPCEVERIGASAFKGCSSLKAYFYGDKPYGYEAIRDDIEFVYVVEGVEWDSYTVTGTFKCNHMYDFTVVAPTCVDDGYDCHTCSKCRNEYHENAVPATGVHAYVYHAEENRIIETCVNGCDHRETATVKTAADRYFFLGESIEPASVQYTDHWHGGELEITYTDNDALGIATAYISLNGAEAYVNFTLVFPENLVEGTVGDNVTWAIREDGIIFIEGTGDMPEWDDSSSVPWRAWEVENHKNFRIRQIVVSGDLTSIGAHAFQYMDEVQSVTLPDGITKIGERAFAGCSDLMAIDLPENLEYIGGSAFVSCESLQELTLPQSVTAIWERLFAGCDSIKSITLGASVQTLYGSSFDDMASLEEILVAADNPYYTSVDGILYTKDMRTLVKYPQNKTESSFHVPNSVEVVGWNAFYGNGHLQEVHIPYSVQQIRYHQNDYDSNLSAVWFYGDAPSIAGSVLGGTQDLVIYYPEGNNAWPSDELSTYTQKPFSCRHKGEEKTVDPTCVKAGYSGLVCVDCGEILETYGEYPANGIHDLVYSIKFADSLILDDTIVETCRACDHQATAEISEPEEYYISTGSPIEPAVVSYSETWLGGNLAITYENNIETGQARASIHIGGVEAFVSFYIESTENLVHGVCGDNLTWVVTSNGTLTIRGTGDMYDYSFDDDGEVAPWCEVCGEGLLKIIIEEGVTSIGANAFAFSQVRSVSIPDTVTRMGECAFEGCLRLTEVVIPSSLKEIPSSAFEECGLKSIVIPEGVTSIGSRAFMECWALTDVTLPVTMSSIGELAFYFTKIKEVYLPLDVSIGACAFYGAEKIYVCTGDLSRVDAEAFGDAEAESFGYDKGTATIYYAESASEWGQREWVGAITVPWANEDHAPLTRNVPPNGCEKGYTFHYCERCGNGYKTDFVDGVAPHVLSYYSIGKTIVETCENGCGHKETATLVLPFPYYAYTEEEITPATLEYSDGWQGGHATIRYQDNCDPGTATAYAEYETATAEIQFTITETPIVALGVCGDDLMWRMEESGLFVVSGTGPMYDYVWWPEDESEPFLPEWYSEDISEDIRELVIEEGVTSIGDFAFSACVNLEHISFPESLQCIGMCAFSGNYALRSIFLPDSLTEIRAEAFYACDSVRTLSINEDLTSVGEYAFACGDPDSMTISFASTREAWENISEEPGVFWMDPDDILYQSFCGIQAESITWVYNRQTKALTIDGSKTILCDPDRFYSKDWAGFRGEVEILSIGANLHDVGKGYENVYYRDNWFAGFTSLSEVTVPEENTRLMSRDGILYDADQEILLLCPARKTHVTIPASVERLEAFAFEDCDALEQVVFEGEPPHTSIAFGHTPFPKSPNVEVLYYVDTPGWDFDPWFTPWINYKCTGISRLTTPEIQRTEGGISFQIDTSSWFRCDKPRVVVCAVYDEAGRMLGLAMVEVTYGNQSMTIPCDTAVADNAILFVIDGLDSLVPVMPSLPFIL